MDFPGGSDSKESVCNAGDPVSIPGSGRSPGEEHGNPIHFSCLGNPMDRGTWQAIVYRVERVGHDLVTNTHTHTHKMTTETGKYPQCDPPFLPLGIVIYPI